MCVCVCIISVMCFSLFFCGDILYGPFIVIVFFFQAEDGIRDLVRSRGLGDVYKRQPRTCYLLELVVDRPSLRVGPIADI